MKIYLLSIDKRRSFFYADESETSSEEDDDSRSSGSPPAGLWSWLDVKFHKYKSIWEHSESRVARWTRQTWDWMHSWAHPDEAMLVTAAIGPTDRAAPPRLARSAEEVLTPLGRIPESPMVAASPLDDPQRRSSPLTVAMLWILPGPNVIGYWFAYRAVHHALIVWGIRRVRRGGFELELRPLAELDRPIEVDDAGKAKHAALDGRGTAPGRARGLDRDRVEPSVTVRAPERPPTGRPARCA